MPSQKLYEKYRPKTLADVVGQPDLWELRQFTREPFESCWLFVGDPGCGKSSVVDALPRDLACDEDDIYETVGAALGVDKAEWYFKVPLRFVGRSAGGWKVLVIEELEWLSKQAVGYLKHALEVKNLPRKTIVLATSNDLSAFPGAFLERWIIKRFSGGPDFAQAAAERVRWVWAQETGGFGTGGLEPPTGYQQWGWQLSDDGKPRYSLRHALDQAQHHLALLQPTGALEAA